MTDRQKLKVYITRKLPESIELRMAELFDIECNTNDIALDRNALIRAMQTYDVLVPTVTDIITADMIAQAGPQLKLITNFGNGVDNIDVRAAQLRKITVTNTPNVLDEDTADMTMALILSVPRRLTEGAQVLTDHQEKWQGWSPTWMLGHRINGKKLGIVGMGRIGTAVARRAKAFGLDVHYHNRRPISEATEKELEATYWHDLNKMLETVDIVSIHCPSTPLTYHLISSEQIGHMKPDSYIVNTARGAVIDETAMIAALDKGHLSGAALDVFEHQTKISDELVRLAKSGKIVLLPHMGSATVESRIDMGNAVICNIHAFYDGHRPPDMVLPEADIA